MVLRARTRGFSLIDVVVGVALFMLILVALAGVLRASLGLSTFAKTDAAASALAASQMEYLRGFSYDALGTSGGIPPGTVAQSTQSTVDGVPYTVKTFIQFYDDPADGLAGSDSNGITTDYKIARVEVDYTYSGHARTVVLVSNFAPPSLETSNGGGTLQIAVTDSSGAPLSGATVQVNNSVTTPTVALSATSNALGIVELPGAATSTEYQISVTKSGDSTAQTYAHTGGNPNPSPGYLTVTKDHTTTSTFAIDRLSTLNLTTYVSNSTSTLSGVTYSLTGAKTIGTTSGGAPVYKTVINSTTGGGGADSQSLEWDAYTLKVTGHDVVDACTAPPYSIAAGTTLNASLYLGPHTSNELLVSVANNAGVPVPGAAVELTKAGVDLIATTTICGNAYFGGLSASTYSAAISATGYASTTLDNIAVSEQTYAATAFP